MIYMFTLSPSIDINSAFHLRYYDDCPHHSDSSLSCLIPYLSVVDNLS